MDQSTSLLQDLMQSLPDIKPRIYFKAALTALSHAMEDLVIDGDHDDRPLVIANFQQERYYRQETQRYQRIADRTDQVYVLAVPETAFIQSPVPYATIGLDPMDELAQEWHLVIICERYCAALICREHAAPIDTSALDTARQFRGFWTFDPQVSRQAAVQLFQRVLRYRPDLSNAVEQARQHYQLDSTPVGLSATSLLSNIDVQLFSDRLVTYLQANQYKQVKAYRRVVEQERQERLINEITQAVRQSLKPEDVLATAIREVGRVFGQCRCVLYRVPPIVAAIEAVNLLTYPPALTQQLRGIAPDWQLASCAPFQLLLQQGQTVAIADVTQDSGIQSDDHVQQMLEQAGIQACLLIPIRYQEKCLAVLELHRSMPHLWSLGERAFLEAIADPIGLALVQAEAYVNVMRLNQQLTAIEQAQNNLIAIVGHELRTPLSTIQVCLESMASEPDMPQEFQQVMLDTALGDSERLRKLVQDFLLLSRLEGDLMSWQTELIDLSESVSLSVSSLQGMRKTQAIAPVVCDLPAAAIILSCDGDALQQLLTKLLENACKFTPATGQITLKAKLKKSKQGNLVAIVISDTGCGIEANRLETIFERFYQEEGFLQRSVGGTGLGLSICRQLIRRLGGKLWATSEGKGMGSQFHVTLPIAAEDA
jgi:DICT domain-containing protein/signal transduction histidine kinase